MELHHDKHHRTYVNSYNTAEEKMQEIQAKGDITAQIAQQSLINFHGGGHTNHTLFWENLAPKGKGGGSLPKGALASAITKEFGSFEDFQKQFNAAAVGVQGKSKPIGPNSWPLTLLSVRFWLGLVGKV